MAASSPSPVTVTTIEELAAIAGLPLSAERRAALAAVVQMLLEGAAALDALDLSEVEPETVFDARWEK